ncbi:MAG: DUF3794 domain-containing protein [Clostridia bacterium]|nr:DUF3794 domain-containing protein [Clostridia bacterium]
MNIETNNEIINVCEVIAKEKRNVIVEGELVVPDIKPDILSIADIDGDVFITKREIKDGRLYIEGSADISAIYLAEDEKTSIRSLNNMFNFYETVDVHGINEGSIIEIQAVKNQIEYKVLNGRKMSVRIPVLLIVVVRNNCEHTFVREISDDRNVEVLSKEIEFSNLVSSKSQDIEVNETITLGQENLPISEILKANIKVINPDYKISYNKILAKADAIIKIIYISDSENQSIETFEGIIPVMGFINYDDLNESSNVKLEFNIKSFTLRPIYQDLKSMSCSVESEMEVKADIYKQNKIAVISDLYDPDINLNCTYENVSIISDLINVGENVELVQGLMIPELDDIKILTINATPTINNKNILDGKIAVEGNVVFDILYYNEAKKIIENKKVDLPYQQVLKVHEIKGNMDVDVNVTSDNIEYRKVDSSQIQIKVNMNFNVTVKEEMMIEGVNSITVLDSQIEETPSIVIYYVKPNDSLWKIAKNYRSTVAEIKEYNMLKDDLIFPNQQLIIPKRSKKMPVEIL